MSKELCVLKINSVTKNHRFAQKTFGEPDIRSNCKGRIFSQNCIRGKHFSRGIGGTNALKIPNI